MRSKLALPLLWLFISCCGSHVAADTNSNISRRNDEFLNGPYGHKFIEMTLENVENSGVKTWYGNWTRDSKANDPSFTKYGEINYFGQVFLQDEDYQCGLGFNGCNRRLNWVEVMMLYPNDTELARRVYFAAKRQNLVNLVMKVIDRSALEAQVSTAALVGKVVTTFTEQEDADAHVNCEILKSTIVLLVEMVVQIAVQAVAYVIPAAVAEEAGVGVEVAGKLAGEAAKKVELAVIKKAARAGFKTICGKPWPSYMLTNTQSTASHMADALTRNYQADALCDDFGGNFKAENPEHIDQLQNILDTVISQYREMLAKNTQLANFGFFAEAESPSQLSDLMFTSIWANETTALSVLTKPYLIKRQFVIQFTQYLASTASRSSGCYMKCNTQYLAEDLCNDNRDSLNRIRICPRPNKVCQLQCWAQWRFPKDLEFYGLNQIDKEPFNMDLKAEMLNAYESFKNYGNRAGSNYWDILPNGNPSLFRLPVCDSDAGYVDITDIYQHGPHTDQKRSFPPSCGNWRSNETKDFMDFIGLGPGTETYERGDLMHLYSTILPLEIDKIIKWPLDHFLAYCEFRMRFPQKRPIEIIKWARHIDTPESKHCDNIKIITQNMTHLEANIEFCTGRYRGPLVDEDDMISNDGLKIFNSRWRCKELMDVLVNDHTEYAGGLEAQKKWKKIRGEFGS